ncbi:MAG: glucose 1-dehydrogenase, partial [Dehalococcoidia bacterium]|nr:glucose 1-dehydrogenase [Dehalococcoidia bacterium]
MRFKDRTVLITGGGRGIGRAISVGFAREGASVAVNAAHLSSAEDTARLVREAGGKALAIEADVTDEERVIGMFDSVVREFGCIDILVNNAGISHPIIPTLEQNTADFDRVIATNLRGAYVCCKAAGKHMVPRRSGKIVNVASISGLTGQPMRTGYAPSKAAMSNLTMALAVEWGCHNINVNAVAPGYVLTDMGRGSISKGILDEQRLANRTALGRLSTPEDIANAVMFLAADESSAITGIYLTVDCGWMANGF